MTDPKLSFSAEQIKQKLLEARAEIYRTLQVWSAEFARDYPIGLPDYYKRTDAYDAHQTALGNYNHLLEVLFEHKNLVIQGDDPADQATISQAELREGMGALLKRYDNLTPPDVP